MAIEVGSEVRTLEGDIDRNQHSGAVGVVTGFARFSSYHPREVWVEFAPHKGAWFWASAVEMFAEQPSPKFLNAEYVASFAA